MHLAAIPSPAPAPLADTKFRRNTWTRYSADETRRQHDEEHGSVGLSVRLTLEDLERLNFWLQPPSGGGVDDPPLKIGEYLWSCLYSSQPPPNATVLLGDVEREIRRHLELELLMAGADKDEKEDISTDEEEAATSALANLSLEHKGEDDSSERAKQPQQGYQKELSYRHLRGTTILLKPNVHETSSGASAASGDGQNFTYGFSTPGRLHDLAISDCSDVHMYLLQPFEHVTIAGCTGCTIVIGAVAGLLHVVDCERTSITAASRRILVSNSLDVLHCVFTPSPPLLVGDNRNCQFGPYNTYYDGLREDLLATGLAAAVVPENQSPYHGNRNPDNDAAWPPLQCASNKWKQPIELSKLEVPQIQTTGSSGSLGSSASGGTASPGADDKAISGPGGGTDTALHTPVLLSASEFHILFVPVESEAARQRRLEAEEGRDTSEGSGPMESQYCRLLAEVLQLSPFRLPVEYERRSLVKAERMRNIQQAAQKNLTEEQQLRFEEELNRGFRDWLVTSGNLRQVLDLVHLERRGGA
jgi:TBCC domain-containing protein 1